MSTLPTKPTAPTTKDEDLPDALNPDTGTAEGGIPTELPPVPPPPPPNTPLAISGTFARPGQAGISAFRTPSFTQNRVVGGGGGGGPEALRFGSGASAGAGAGGMDEDLLAALLARKRGGA